MATRQPWHRLPNESSVAFAAFQLYLEHGTVDDAYRAAPDARHARARVAAGHWHGWSVKHHWVSRAAAYQEYLAEQDRKLWERRRRQLRERDWAQADALRAIVDESIPHAEQFIRRRTTTIGDQTIVTLAFNITDLARVLEIASNRQRLTTNDPTEHVQYTGAALDSFIAAELARLVDSGQASIGGEIGADATALDAATGGGDETV